MSRPLEILSHAFHQAGVDGEFSDTHAQEALDELFRAGYVVIYAPRANTLKEMSST